MQPSEYEIQREVEALRDIRRRSTAQGGPGALILDPDLPNQSPPSSPTASYWSGASPALTDVDSTSSSLESGPSSDNNSTNPTDDPFHLFWVPASLHPEIAPAEFRAFLKEHARSPAADGTTPLQRSSSNVSTSPSQTGLGRRKSMLSRQYKPSENDGVENEQVISVQRKKSIYMNQGPQLTINELEALEVLAEEASESDDPTKLRNALRRRLSYNISPSAIDETDQLPEIGDEADSPIIVPPPGQILRRSARTKIRKTGLPGDGGGHRFGERRRASPHSSAPTPPSVHRTSTSSSSSEQGDSVDSYRPRTFSGESLDADAVQAILRPESYGEETLYDGYFKLDEDSEGVASVLMTSPPSLTVDLPTSPTLSHPEVAPALISPPIHHPQPQRYLIPPSPQDQQPSPRTPSPDEHTLGPISRSPNQGTPPFLPPPLGPSPHQRKERGIKKGLFSKWGGDKATKRSSKEKERENRERTEKEGEGGFFGSLFSSRRKPEDNQHTLGHGASGREAARALLGASGSPRSPMPSPGGLHSYARYPIHVERAIYRLSHIKLANPRRALYEQVLISNLMFWYLGVINKAQNPATSPAPSPTADPEKEQKEREMEERLKVEKEKERLEKEKEMMEQQKKKESQRRGSLTKALSTGSVGVGRRAEMPVKGPQYDLQHRVIEQEYNGFNGQPSNTLPAARSMTAPAGSGTPQPAQYPRIQQTIQPSLQIGQPMPQPQPQPQIPNNFYYGGMSEQQPRGGSMNLPPGAMPPVAIEQSAWLAPSVQRPLSPGAAAPYPPRRSRSPPPPHMMNRYQPVELPPPLPGQMGGKLPMRSISANVQPSPHVNGKIRKGNSVSVTVPNGRRPRTSEGAIDEEEEVPLALWQQQKWK